VEQTAVILLNRFKST